MLYIKVTLCVTDCFSQHKIKSICINVKILRIKPSRFSSMVKKKEKEKKSIEETPT